METIIDNYYIITEIQENQTIFKILNMETLEIEGILNFYKNPESFNVTIIKDPNDITIFRKFINSQENDYFQ